ncbi:glycoside hydrolase superfamily, partial [Phakopsora pachyrhizi]
SVIFQGYNAELLPPENIPWDLYDHLDYFVAKTGPNPESDIVIENETNLKVVASAAKSHNVTISLSIGGWTGSKYFSSLVASEQSRKTFAESILRVVKKYELDGIDIDWEFPNQPGDEGNQISKDDSSNFLKFLSILRQILGPKARLSAAVSVKGFSGPDGQYLTDLKDFGEVLDFITIMAYDIFGPGFSSVSGPNAPLFDTCNEPTAKFSVSRAIKNWISTGFPASKILLGIPGYGYQYQLLDSSLNKSDFSGKSNKTSFIFNQISKGAASSTNIKVSSFKGPKNCGGPVEGYNWLFKDLINCGLLSPDAEKGLNGFERHYDNCSHTPFLFNPSSKTLISYDDPRSLALKAKYSKSKGLAGINLFDATGDTQDQILLKAVKSKLTN